MDRFQQNYHLTKIYKVDMEKRNLLRYSITIRMFRLSMGLNK